MNSRYLTPLVVASLLLTALTVGVAPAAADSNGVLGDFGDGEDDGRDWGGTVKAGIAGSLERIQWQVSQLRTSSDDGTNLAESDAVALQDQFNAANTTLEPYVNNRFGGNYSAWNVIEITHTRDDETFTHYIVADVDNESFVNAKMVNSTNRTVDKQLGLSGFASDNAASELDYFATEFAEPGNNVTDAYEAELASKYGKDVTLPEGFER